MRVGVKYNPDTEKYDVVDDDTGSPLMHQTRGNRVDGGGHSDQSSAERQKGYLQKYYDKQEAERQNNY